MYECGHCGRRFLKEAIASRHAEFCTGTETAQTKSGENEALAEAEIEIFDTAHETIDTVVQTSQTGEGVALGEAITNKGPRSQSQTQFEERAPVAVALEWTVEEDGQKDRGSVTERGQVGDADTQAQTQTQAAEGVSEAALTTNALSSGSVGRSMSSGSVALSSMTEV